MVITRNKLAVFTLAQKGIAIESKDFSQKYRIEKPKKNHETNLSCFVGLMLPCPTVSEYRETILSQIESIFQLSCKNTLSFKHIFLRTDGVVLQLVMKNFDTFGTAKFCFTSTTIYILLL